jgi:hypothetical protein
LGEREGAAEKGALEILVKRASKPIKKLTAASLHCGKKHRTFPSQITDAADHNRPVTENSEIKSPTS